MNRDVVFALVKKEFFQIVRDPSSILIAFILPSILLFLFGFGINFDTNTVKIGAVIQDRSPLTLEILDTMRHTRFLEVKIFESVKTAEAALKQGSIKGFAVVPVDFSKNYFVCKNFARENSACPKMPEIQVITDGSEPNTAKFVSAYVQGAVQTFAAVRSRASGEFVDGGLKSLAAGAKILVNQRFWYNPALKSTYFILPGSVAIVMTMIGTVLTALVIAREWERGTMEALLTTEVTRLEFILAKYIAYFALGIASIIFSLFIIIFIFKVPFMGSIFALLFISALFMLGALGLGFLISTVARDQFVASQIAGVAGFMPSLMLSGLIYEINSMPLFLRILTVFIPARYYVSSITSLFLSGLILKTFIIDSLILGLFAALTFFAVYFLTPLRFEGR